MIWYFLGGWFFLSIVTALAVAGLIRLNKLGSGEE